MFSVGSVIAFVVYVALVDAVVVIDKAVIMSDVSSRVVFNDSVFVVTYLAIARIVCVAGLVGVSSFNVTSFDVSI